MVVCISKDEYRKRGYVERRRNFGEFYMLSGNWRDRLEGRENIGLWFIYNNVFMKSNSIVG